MASDNPLLALGVPRHVLVLAVKDKNPKLALDIAEANYKSLAKKFHPDLPGGDAAYMSALGDAMEEIRDLDALDYYLSELVGRSDVAEAKVQAKIKKSAAQLEKRDSFSLRAVADLFEYVDQFTMLGLRKPTSFITFGQEVTMTVSVTDSDSSEIVAYRNPEMDLSVEEFRLTAGKWQFKNPTLDSKKAWQELGDPDMKISARAVGYVIRDRNEEVELDNEVQALGSGAKIKDLQWTKASDSWFLPFISFGGLPVTEKESLDPFNLQLVLHKRDEDTEENLFSVTQRVLKFSAIK
ncbi:MAG: hypothetical protein RLZZ508_98 [Actinomycetota bacterium]|jgi:hypothetical protein